MFALILFKSHLINYRNNGAGIKIRNPWLHRSSEFILAFTILLQHTWHFYRTNIMVFV